MEEPVKRRLLARGVLAPDNWLNTCMNNFRTSDEYAPGQDKLEDYVFKQWLLEDLSELRVSSFPPDLNDQLKVTLNGRYTCQIVSVIDTGHSAYSQYQKIRNVDTGNLAVDNEKDTFQAKWEPKSSRTLLISITDGIQELVALEVKRIPSLSINLIPGCKAVIKGPITCRRGYIMLEREDQITLLGGQIESFLVPNAYENILGLSLGIPINENARVATGVATDELPNEDQRNEAERRDTNPPAGTGHTNSSVPVVRIEPQPRAQPQPKAPAQRNRPIVPPQRTLQTWISSNQNFQQHEDDFPDDDALLSIDLDNVVGMEMQEQNTGSCSGDTGSSAGRSAGRTHLVEQSRSKPDTHKPEVLPSRSNKQSKPYSPTYDFDIDDELLYEFANDLEEDDFNRAKSSNTVPENSEKQSRMLEKSAKPNEAVENSGKPRKSPVCVVHPSKSIDNWFKPNKTVGLGNSVRPTTVPENPGRTNSENPWRTFGNSESSKTLNSSAKPSTHLAQTLSASELKDIGEMMEDDDDDILWLDEEGSVVQTSQNFRTQNKTATKSQKPSTENTRKPGNVRAELADVVKDISEGNFDEATTVEVKVKIQRVVETLNIKNDEWKMAVQITDGSAVLDVSISSEAVTKIFGITPAEGVKRRKEAIRDLSVREELKLAFRQLENTFKKLDCIFEVLIKPGQRPCVLDIQV